MKQVLFLLFLILNITCSAQKIVFSVGERASSNDSPILNSNLDIGYSWRRISVLAQYGNSLAKHGYSLGTIGIDSRIQIFPHDTWGNIYFELEAATQCPPNRRGKVVPPYYSGGLNYFEENPEEGSFGYRFNRLHYEVYIGTGINFYFKGIQFFTGVGLVKRKYSKYNAYYEPTVLFYNFTKGLQLNAGFSYYLKLKDKKSK